jgi:hypothetical protein
MLKLFDAHEVAKRNVLPPLVMGLVYVPVPGAVLVIRRMRVEGFGTKACIDARLATGEPRNAAQSAFSL